MHLLLCEKAPAPPLHVCGDPLHLPEQHSCPDCHSAVSTGSPHPPPALQEALISTSLLYPAGSSCGEVLCSLAAFLNSPLLFLRCVSDRQRSFALGIQWIVVRTLGMEQSEFGHWCGLLALWSVRQAVA